MPKQGRNKGQISAEGQTALADAAIALGAGWGNAATATFTSGSNDVAGQVTVTSGGTGQLQTTATVAITFTTPYATAPRAVIITTTNDNSIDTGHATYSVSTTALTITFAVLPVTAKVYKFNYVCIA